MPENTETFTSFFAATKFDLDFEQQFDDLYATLEKMKIWFNNIDSEDFDKQFSQGTGKPEYTYSYLKHVYYTDIKLLVDAMSDQICSYMVQNPSVYLDFSYGKTYKDEANRKYYDRSKENINNTAEQYEKTVKIMKEILNDDINSLQIL
ncbi:hypothetical protein JOC36_000915 [Weissella uvarum]|uniref:hypothetical protein n=1 Tax=Weissella uvarum TaxID=1479233 RepID=UPI00195FEDE8|nr:hypothetical protein [Weissella uvarum]MBM7617358.1 hypothetical protein [Weissella uvarum]MCM0595755.1 hypothetical protein [Weissella uvarum]